jgi:hypothetical protein
MAFGTLPDHVRHQRFAAVHFHTDCERGVNGTTFRKARRLCSCGSPSEHCKNGNRVERHHAALAKRNRESHSWIERLGGLLSESKAIRESRIS